MAQTVRLVIIDPNKDFMDLPGSSLAVPGANADMDRVAAMVERVGSKFASIHVTMDSHFPVDVGHPAMWVGADGNQPPPFTIIRANDIRAGLWTPRHAHARVPALKVGDRERTIKQYMIEYAETLELKGRYLLTVWPTHCVIGTDGWGMHKGLRDALTQWEIDQFKTLNVITKGTNPWTEHYGALQAEVPLPTDPSTGLNKGALDIAQTADVVLFCGEAESHCLRTTVTQFVENVDPALVKKFYLLTDATSPIPKIGDGPDFPAETAKWRAEMVALGMNLTTTVEFMA